MELEHKMIACEVSDDKNSIVLITLTVSKNISWSHNLFIFYLFQNHLVI